MKSSLTTKSVDVGNIFSINRLGILIHLKRKISNLRFDYKLDYEDDSSKDRFIEFSLDQF